MKRSLLTLGAITALSLVPVGGAPLLARAIDAGKTVAENVVYRPKVELNLSAEKKVVELDVAGKQKVTWQALEGAKATVQPDDVLRYTLGGANNGNRPAKNVVVTQPIPQGMVYVLDSAAVGSQNAALTYSIDGGKTFVTKPTIQVTLANGKVETRPAPAKMYTHIRLSLNNTLDAKAIVKASYQVNVQ